MKNLKLLFILFCGPWVLVSGQDWTTISTCCGDITRAMLVIDSTTLMLSEDNEISITTDKGADWNLVYNNESTINNISDISMNPQGRIYAVYDIFNSDYGGFIYTDNFGETWEKRLVPNLKYPYTVYFLNNEIGFIGCSNAAVFKTIDGGVTWKKVLQKSYSNFHTIVFANDSVGFAAGGRSNQTLKYKTTDGGESWEGAGIPGVHIKKIEFPSPEVGYAVAFNRVSKTINGGLNWTSLNLPVSDGFGLLSFPTDSIGYVTTTYYLESTGGWHAGSSIFYTEDGGNTWTEQFTDDDQLYEIYRIDFQNNTGFMCGDLSGLYSTKNTSISEESGPVNTVTPIPELDLQIIPNPSSDEIRLSHWVDFFYIVYSENGELLIKGNTQDAISIRELPDGNYFLHVWKDEISKVLPFLKI